MKYGVAYKKTCNEIISEWRSLKEQFYKGLNVIFKVLKYLSSSVMLK